jgi:hypothetical protein
MSEKDEKAGTTEEAQPKGAQCGPDMCREMMSGGIPEHCAQQIRKLASGGTVECPPQMREMMSRFFATSQKGAEKSAGEA